MIHVAKAPRLDFLFNHGHTTPPPLPMLFDSRGNFCWELNSYLTSIGGGANSYGVRPAIKTVFSYADTLNVFQEYIERNKLTILDVTDETLYDFVKHKKHSRTANSTTIKKIVRRILALLEHTQKENKFHNLLTTDPSAHDFQINATENFYRLNRRTPLRFLTHPCIDELRDTPTEPTSFIRNNELNAWHEAIHDYTPNQYLIDRWYILATLLEHTGSRIEETINIPASSIINAYKNNGPVINIPVLKGKHKGCLRQVLIPRTELQEIYKFVLLTRSNHPHSELHDRIFVSEDTGYPLARSTFNSYYNVVIKASRHAELLKGISYHNFRHRYFTILVAKNISTLSKTSKANILDVAMAIARKDSYHASKSTLSTYIHLTQDAEIQDILKAEPNASTTLQTIQSIVDATDDRSSDEKLAAITALIKAKFP
ncbi:TPA: tyrosine-type recombinase/integrase [Pseudomonas aeruginosa]|uniref:site-specific integrase n=1 Tax=Pseudomonas TaxID=286 RepID=UPI0009A3CFFB|nr:MULTISPECIES: site-specific integrase [Pseudomonas]HBO1072966.1 tyrosine-type recombinase/integrase [Pseudomonas aeruginosa]HBO1987049.1 tyrosine-type recombinase/integrase [Pseudomonas aeruginosa]HBO8369825.1 tyrosine-type recombinase/integrase [Pseudomonas aeruginosa]HCE6936553.1 tyrosine-type recombinase/integrase [Pseudomonas aeruginosa]HCE7667890.1 tyrosine-type recombinase/integrase [Pseudomonas aeruginosa]